jgi:hypothetical protein
MLTSTGIMVTATINEATSARATVSESGTKNLETIPPTRAKGRKTAIVVSVDEVMALATSVVPLNAWCELSIET